LLEEPYFLTIDQVGSLTLRQLFFLYYRDRNKDGTPKVLPYYFKSKTDQELENIAMFRSMGKAMGKSDEEIEKLIENAKLTGQLHG
jgi:hypothetical protein